MTCPCACHLSQSWCCETCAIAYVEVPAAEYPRRSCKPEVIEVQTQINRGIIERIQQLEKDNQDLLKRIAAIESSPMMKLKARCNRCGKEVDPSSPAHLCLVPGGVIVNG